MSTIESLRQQIGQRKSLPAQPSISTGCSELDRLFPQSGIRPGSVIELMSVKSLSEAALMALLVAKQILTSSQTLLILDPTKSIYAPTLSAMGLDLRQVLYVTPRSRKDALWACDQGLRCQAVGIVIAMQLEGDATTFRRFQIAAEGHGTIGCFVFDARRSPHRCWGDVRLGVESRPRGSDDGMRFRIDVQRSLRGNIGDSLTLDVTSEGRFHVPPVRTKTYSLRLVSSLANTTTRFA